jgi:hypothetical protein
MTQSDDLFERRQKIALLKVIHGYGSGRAGAAKPKVGEGERGPG